MELDQLDLAPEVASRGFGLAEKAAINVAVVGLLGQSKLSQASLWGKLYGQKADYIVLLCHSGDPLGNDASAFFSIDGGVNFTLLPAPRDEVPARLAPIQPDDADEPVVPVTVQSLFARASQSGALSGPFIGDPAFEYRVQDPLSKSVFVLKESERLACFVALQGRIGRVVPRGAYLRRPADAPANRGGKASDLFTIRANSAFDGLDDNAAGRLASYVHLRKETRQRLLLEQEGTATNLDWLDPLSEDEPAGCWALQLNQSAGIIVGASLELLGSVFCHQPKTAVFGSLYMGDGNVNRDLAFML